MHMGQGLFEVRYFDLSYGHTSNNNLQHVVITVYDIVVLVMYICSLFRGFINISWLLTPSPTHATHITIRFLATKFRCNTFLATTFREHFFSYYIS